jgi:hypothetical protein
MSARTRGRSPSREPLEGLRRHKLMPKAVAATLPRIGSQDGLGGDAVVYLKLFSPYGRYKFYVTEFDGDDELYGYCVSPLGPDCDEYGSASLREIAETTVFGSVPSIERDCYYQPRRLAECEAVSL